MKFLNPSRALLAFSFVLMALAAHAQAVLRVDSLGINVTDLERSVRFYEDVLTFEEVGREELTGDDADTMFGVFGTRVLVARMLLGREQVELRQFLAPEGRLVPRDTKGNDLWFQHAAIIVRDMDAAYARLRAHGVRHASSGPQRLPDWNPNAGGIRAFYFKDPDGNPLEILEFPEGKGDPRWHQPGEALFLGIDHSAITVSDTEASLRFWRDQLGLKVAGGALNHGPEQDRLNGVPGVRLRITTLRAEGGGPGVELLEYVMPGPGRPRPADTAANDGWHWTVNVATPDAGAPRMARDPDGHAALLR